MKYAQDVLDEIVRLHTEENLTRCEISEKLGIGINTIYRHLKREHITGTKEVTLAELKERHYGIRK